MPRQDNDEWGIASSVGLTALGVASGRAIESKRPDPLVVDPHADTLVAAAQIDPPMPTQLPHPGFEGDTAFEKAWSQIATGIGLRSRFFDEYFAEAWQSGITQAVILASGLDARSWRLEWPKDAVVFEIDQPRVLAFKDDLLLNQRAVEPQCTRIPVAIDLREDWPAALVEAGFDTERPTAWLAEGLLPYLPDHAEAALLRQIAGLSAPGSRVALEHARMSLAQIADAAEDDAMPPGMADRFGVDVRELVYETEDRPDPDQRLAEHGWTATVSTSADLAASYGRNLEGVPSRIVGAMRYITARLPE